MDFIIRLLIFVDWKNNNSNLILIIINLLIKIVCYKRLKVLLSVFILANVILDIIL